GAWAWITRSLVRVAGSPRMCAARRGRESQTSGTNELGQAHDVKNLFIVDGSVFVIAGGVSPTSTIQALALYIADGIKENIPGMWALTACSGDPADAASCGREVLPPCPGCDAVDNS